ncbi:type I-E CRISPR-associated protein Cas5/CasD [Escherichia coli]|nr:type I-E CRISPR-associated protein Cas5/CasD [Escherichia coli]
MFDFSASWANGILGRRCPGEVRHTHELPSRSALLGLLAAGVGIRRDDTERLNVFNRHYSLVVCASRNPRWARDYHTIQMPKEVRKARYFSRREELSDPDLLSAIISRRDYYTDAWWMVAVATTADAPYSSNSCRAVYAIQFFRFIWGEKVIRWHYHLRRYCLKATRLMFYVTHITSIRSISTT